MRRAALVSVVASVLSQACLGVPDVDFVADDAEPFADGGSVRDVTVGEAEAEAEPEGGPDAAANGDGTTAGDTARDGDGWIGAGVDSAMASGEAAATGCPDAAPPGAALCCGPVPCRGTQPACTSACTNCMNDCADAACCLDKHGNYQGCAATAEACP